MGQQCEAETGGQYIRALFFSLCSEENPKVGEVSLSPVDPG